MKNTILFFFLIVSSLQAQDILTIDKAVEIARLQNRTLAGARNDLESARWGKLNSYTNFLPKIEFSTSVTQIDQETEARANAAIEFIKVAAGKFGIPPEFLTDIRPFVYRTQYASDFTLVQPIYNGGAEILGWKAADASFAKSRYSLLDAEQDVVARVRSAYYAVLKAAEFSRLAAESLERTKRHLETTKRRASLGTKTETDVLRWEVQLAADEGNYITAENFLVLSRFQLNELMGEPLEKTFEIEPVVIADSSFTEIPFSGAAVSERTPVTLASLADHPTMMIMETQLRLAELNISKSWINFQPKVNLAFQYGWEKNNTPAFDGIRPWAVSLMFGFPIFNSFGDYSNLQKSEAEYRSAEDQIASYKNGMALQAVTAQYSVRSARKRIETALKGLRQARDVFDAVSRRYEMGGASGLDLLDVQTAYAAAQSNFIGAVYDFLTASVQLERAFGKTNR